jgi:hypothetical protein
VITQAPSDAESQPPADVSTGFIAYVLLFLALIIFSVAVHGAYQPVVKAHSDYALSLGAAIVVFFALYFPRRPADPRKRRERALLAFGIAYMVVFFGRSVFFTFNAAFDRGPSQSYLAVIERVGCGRGAQTWWIRGAPSLPTETNQMAILGAGCGPFEGDSVVVEVKSGALRRPWVARYDRW